MGKAKIQMARCPHCKRGQPAARINGTPLTNPPTKCKWCGKPIMAMTGAGVVIFVDPTTDPVPTPRTEKSGNKYHRRIHGLKAYWPDGTTGGTWVTVDVYSVLTAFPTGHPGLDHAVKKILCAGIRGKGSRVQDLKEARDALDRAIEDAEAAE